MLLILIGLGIAIGIALIIAGLIAYWPINSFISAFTESKLAILVLGIILGLPVTIFLSGFTGTFFTALYTLFYFELVEPTPVPVTTGTGGTLGPESTPPPLL